MLRGAALTCAGARRCADEVREEFSAQFSAQKEKTRSSENSPRSHAKAAKLRKLPQSPEARAFQLNEARAWLIVSDDFFLLQAFRERCNGLKCALDTGSDANSIFPAYFGVPILMSPGN